MSTTIDQAFIEQFESEVHLAYQRQGSKLRNTVRQKTGIQGKQTTFQTVAKGSATQKSRHGDVPPMNQTHTPVVCTLQDWYAGDYVDRLDELKINIDERQIVASSGAYALGRKSDELITTAADTTSNTTVHGSTGLTKAKVYTVFTYFGENDVPEDGERYWVVAPEQWTNLLDLSEFANADYVGPAMLPFAGGMMAKRWMSFMFFGHSGLPISSTTRKTFAYHRTALGHAVGHEVDTDITWQGTKQAHFVVNKMSQGSCLIDTVGVYEVQATET